MYSQDFRLPKSRIVVILSIGKSHIEVTSTDQDNNPLSIKSKFSNFILDLGNRSSSTWKNTISLSPRNFKALIIFNV